MTWKRNLPLSSDMGGIWEHQIRSARAISNSLLKLHGRSLSVESSQTLLVEVEVIINSRPLTTDGLNNVSSVAPLSPVKLLTMKSKVQMPLPCHITSPDRYSRKPWRRAQHLSKEFWNQWRKEVLLTLQNCGNWNKQHRNCKVGDVALLKEEAERNRWPIVKILAKSDNSIHYLERPVNKMVTLVENEDGNN